MLRTLTSLLIVLICCGTLVFVYLTLAKRSEVVALQGLDKPTVVVAAQAGSPNEPMASDEEIFGPNAAKYRLKFDENPPIAQVEADSALATYYRFGKYREFNHPNRDFFRGINKIGVHDDFIASFGERREDFDFILSDIENREDFLRASGHAFRFQDRNWNILIRTAFPFDGGVRVLASCTVGVDYVIQSSPFSDENENYDGGPVYELWALRSDGSPPELLERTLILVGDGKTKAEREAR